MSRRRTYVLGGVGILFVLLGTCRYGPAESSDSAAYYSTARSLVAGEGFRTFKDEPYAHWPPLIPLVLAGFGVAGVEPRLAFRVVNAFAFAGIVVTVTAHLRSRLTSEFLILVGSLGTLFSFPLLRVSLYAFSEPLFVLCTLLCLRELTTRCTRRGTRGTEAAGTDPASRTDIVATGAAGGVGKAIVLDTPGRAAETRSWSCVGLTPRAVRAGLAAGAAMTARYAGLVVIGIGAAHFLLMERSRLSHRLRAVLAFLLLSCVPISLWWIRNYALAGSTIGERSASTVSYGANIALLLDNASWWLLPPQVPAMVRIVILIALTAAMIFPWVGAARGRRTALATRIAVWPWAGFAALYSAFLVHATSTVRFGEPLNQRYAVPLFAPLLILSLESAQRVWRSAGRWGRQAIGAVLLTWLAGMAAGTGVTLWHFGWRGGAFSSPEWRGSEGAAFLRQHEPDGTLYSNQPAVVYLLTGLAARDLPSEVLSPDVPTWERRVVENQARGGRSYIVWWKSFPRTHIYTLDELSPLVTLEPVADLKDATVVRVGR